jgi:NAD(P)-dependent dehydrogenase (short-subunit alcohol dehydrogenase family)
MASMLPFSTIDMKSPLESLTVFLTGATGGIGRATARALAEKGASLLLHGRDERRLGELVSELSSTGARILPLVADLSSLAETVRLAREAAKKAPGLDVLINNAGVGFGKDSTRRERSRDGFELRFAVNYLAAFVLSEELLARGLPRRAIVNVASAGQEMLDFSDLMTDRGYGGVRAYCRSKLAMIMMSFDLAALHPGLRVQALHPGTYLDSGMVREAGIRPLGPVSRGAESIVAVLEEALRGGESGRYFDQSSPARALAQAYDENARGRLREASLAVAGPFRKQERT